VLLKYSKTVNSNLISAGLDIPYSTTQNQLMAPVRSYAQQNNIKDIIALWARQAAGKSKRELTHNIIKAQISCLE